MAEPVEIPIPCIPLTEEDWTVLSGTLRLSGRELDIIQGVFLGETESAIAEALGISPHTVHSYFDRVYRKLHVSGRTALVVRIFAEYLRLSSGPPPRALRLRPNRRAPMEIR